MGDLRQIRMGVGMGDKPFLRRHDLDNARLHSILVDPLHILLEVAELLHGRLEDGDLAALIVVVWSVLLVVIVQVFQIGLVGRVVFFVLVWVQVVAGWGREGGGGRMVWVSSVL